MVAEKWQIPVERQRYWHWAKRQNMSVRISVPLGQESDATRVSEIRVSQQSMTSAVLALLDQYWHCLLYVRCHMSRCGVITARRCMLCSTAHIARS